MSDDDHIGEGHVASSAHFQGLVSFAGMAHQRIDPGPWGESVPLLGFGVGVLCRCNNPRHSPEHDVPALLSLAVPVFEAGRLVASVFEHADRSGLSYALGAAVDQGREWAKRAPR